MAKDYKNNRRKYPRFSLMGTLPGEVKCEGQSLEVLPVDISESGVGLLLGPAPRPGSIITWQPPQGATIELELIWSQVENFTSSMPGMDDMRRCGLQLKDTKKDLIEICKKIPELQMVE